MCGILGVVSKTAKPSKLCLSDYLNGIKHRGPDDQGIFETEQVSLGHTRLSILDLSTAGHQPMLSACGEFVIVFNGEVYNFLEVRAELIELGLQFTTQTDTEVVLAAYIKWGAECLKKFVGMFAFAIWDMQQQQLFTARDRLGEKPFIYALTGEQYSFSSEFKALVPMLPEMPKLDVEAVDMYMHYQYTPEPYTLLDGVGKLPAAHYGILDVKKWNYKEVQYWSILDVQPDSAITKNDIKDELERAVKYTLRSDVEVGVALSAGIDSAGIAAIASQHYDGQMQAFSVGYPGRPAYDERQEAQEIASSLGLKFNEVEIATEGFVHFFDEFVSILDEPVADIAAFGHYSVPKACRDGGVKVLLTGIGGDEVFWGYDWCRLAVPINAEKLYLSIIAKLLGPFVTVNAFYKLLRKLSRTTRVPIEFKEFCRKLLAWVENETPSDQLLFMVISGAPEFTKFHNVGQGWYGEAMSALSKQNPYQVTADSTNRGDTLGDISLSVTNMLFKTWLSGNCLTLGDRVSMAVGVESRLPFLDYKLIETVLAWRQYQPDHGLGQKAVLREILTEYLPEKTVKRPKSGFVPPVVMWINGIVSEYGHLIKDGVLVEQGIVAESAAEKIAKNGGSNLTAQGLYRLVLLEVWYRSLSDIHRKNSVDINVRRVA